MLTDQQIRAHVEALSEKHPAARAFALRVNTKWTGPDTLPIRGKPHRIVASDSELALRDAMSAAERDQVPLVLLTAREDSELGEDLLARLARMRVLPLSSSEMLRHLFRAKDIEPRLRHQLWLAELLVEAAPPDGYPPIPGGRLDEDTVIEAFLRQVMGFASGRPDLAQVLEWGRQAGSAERLQKLGEPAVTRLEEWLRRTAGPPASLVLAVMKGNQPISLLALGLISAIVFREGADPALATAQGRLERYFGPHVPTPAEAQQLGAAAAMVLERHLQEEQARHDLEVLDQLFLELRIESYTVESGHSPSGLERRFEALGLALETCLQKADRGSLESLAHAYGAVESHQLVRTQAERRQRALMAVRLCRWLTMTPGSPEGGLHHMAEDYARVGSFVDWARHDLFHGDSCPELSRAYGQIVQRVGLRREEDNRAFGKAMAAATLQGNLHGLPGVEDIIPQVVAPLLAKQGRVLFLVVDGLSLPVFRELTPSLQEAGLVALAPCEGSQPQLAVAGIPSMTHWTRRLLLGGREGAIGSQPEKSIFASHPGLSGYRGARAPVLFLKGDMTQAGNVGVSAEVRAEIDGDTPLVGVVLNAVDDHLLKGDQMSVSWTLERIPLLQQLLSMAGNAERVVVLTADHGHVLENDSCTLSGDGQDRYRLKEGPPHDFEIELRGKRVAPLVQGRCTALWSERAIYGLKKNGYHGGVSPQEMLVPVAVLARSLSIPQGWQDAAEAVPEWWTGIPTQLTAAAPEPRRGPERKAQSSRSRVPAPEPAQAPWAAQLFASDIFKQQHSKAGRVAPSLAVIRQALVALDERGGAMLVDALASRIGMQVFRMNGFLAGLQRVLNVEGYPVLSLDMASNTVRLNLELLKTQFDLTPA